MPDDSDNRPTKTIFICIGAIFILALSLIIFEPNAARWVAEAVQSEFVSSDQPPQPPDAPKLAGTPNAR